VFCGIKNKRKKICYSELKKTLGCALGKTEEKQEKEKGKDGNHNQIQNHRYKNISPVTMHQHQVSGLKRIGNTNQQTTGGTV
jgi:hypothetical protein